MTEKTAKPTKLRKSRIILGPHDWINAAREVLVQEGAERVLVERLAKRLGVSRGSFYWHFQDRDALLGALLDLWKETALEPMRAVAGNRSIDALERYKQFMRVWVDGEPYCPILDLAIRRWALVDADVSQEVKKMDKKRIKLLSDIFHDMGYDADEALIRARVTYFHQIGYYATDVRDPPGKRVKYWPIYTKVLTGK